MSIAAAAAWPAFPPRTARCCGKRRVENQHRQRAVAAVLEDGKIFLSGGYNAGSLLLQLEDQGGKLAPKMVWKLGRGSLRRDPADAHFPRRPHIRHAAQRAIRLPGPGRQGRLGQPAGGFLWKVSLPAGGRPVFCDERGRQTQFDGRLHGALQSSWRRRKC